VETAADGGPTLEAPAPLTPRTRVSVATPATESSPAKDYFPQPESKGGWRKLNDSDSIRRIAGMNPDKLTKLRAWLRESDERTFAAVVIRPILGHSGDARTAKLAFDPGTACGYSTHALAHAALVCETVTGKPYDQFAIEALFKPCCNDDEPVRLRSCRR
jgi:Beta-lactamase